MRNIKGNKHIGARGQIQRESQLVRVSSSWRKKDNWYVQFMPELPPNHQLIRGINLMKTYDVAKERYGITIDYKKIKYIDEFGNIGSDKQVRDKRYLLTFNDAADFDKAQKRQERLLEQDVFPDVTMFAVHQIEKAQAEYKEKIASLDHNQ